ncbi:MAG: hypothetical protein K5855_10275 [Oscillospiraceae bacterium]|jgi:hypothetical protein|nr:hypothetical protein [Oscillospiraceae bacterium]
MKTVSVISLLLGAASIVLCFINKPIGAVCAAVSLISGIIAYKSPVEKKSLAAAGMTCGVVGLLLNVVFLFVGAGLILLLTRS